MRTELRIVYVRSISNELNSCKTSFKPRFSRNKQAYTASNRSHAHLIGLNLMTHGEVLRPPLLWIGNRAWKRLKSIVAAAIQIMKLAWVTYLGALLSINAILIPQILAHLPILAQCKVHRPWALFSEGTVKWKFGNRVKYPPSHIRSHIREWCHKWMQIKKAHG